VAWFAEPLTRYRVHGASATASSMVSLEQVAATRRRAIRFDGWLRAQLDKHHPRLASRWRHVEEQGGFLWLTFLERWLSGAGKDIGLLLKVLRHRDTREAPWQHRAYYCGSLVLPKGLFVAYSRLIFGSSPIKAKLRKLLGRA
jgi:hypothetical protein